MHMFNCEKCEGKVFVDTAFTTGKDYEMFCIKCGKRYFIHRGHRAFKPVDEFVRRSNVA